MIVLKEVIHYPETNSVEATWVDRTQAPDVQVAEVPEVLATYDEEGNELTPYIAAVPAHTVPGEITEVQVKCHSYAACQMDMLAADLGPEDALLHTDLMEAVTASYLPPEPEPVVIPAISPRQIRQALTRVGMRQSVETAVAAADQDIKDWWEFSTSFERNHPAVEAMIVALGIEAAHADAVWRLGATL